MKTYKRKKNKKAKFFCESCGHEVSEKAKVCNFCGKFFSSVRCPKCGNTGSTEEFIHGCPQCGYAVTPNGVLSNSRKPNNNPTSLLRDIFSGSRSSSAASAQAAGDGSLPFWIYIVAVACLAGIIFCVYSCL